MILTVDHKLCFSANLSNSIMGVAYVNSLVRRYYILDNQTLVIIFNDGSVEENFSLKCWNFY